MLSKNQIEAITPNLKIMQAIVGVLIVGALLPLLLLTFVREKPIFNQELGLLTLLGIAFGMIMFVTVFWRAGVSK